MRFDFAQLRSIQERLVDDESRKIFDVRFDFAVTGNWHNFLKLNESKKFNLPFLTSFMNSLVNQL